MDFQSPTRNEPTPFSGHPPGPPSVTTNPIPVSVGPITPLAPTISPPAPAPPPPQPEPPTPPRKRRRKRHWIRNTLIVLAIFPLFTQGVAFAVQAGYTPPTTAYMLQSKEPVTYEYVELEHISRYMIGATIAHEDQRLGPRAGGFEWADLWARAEAHFAGKDDPSGSTIPQQLLKNMYLWEDPNAARKGIEAVLATQYAYTLDDQRMLELYLNYAQFGPGLYGICAASWYYFNTPPWAMYEYHTWQLQGILPLPSLVRRAPEGGIDLSPASHPKVRDLVNGAANVWLPLQLSWLGGWEGAAGTIGITDLANDHADKRTEANSCSTMPQSVKDRLDAEAVNPRPQPPW